MKLEGLDFGVLYLVLVGGPGGALIVFLIGEILTNSVPASGNPLRKMRHGNIRVQ